MKIEPFQPNPFERAGAFPGTRPAEIKTVLGLLAGAASVCWENPRGAGIFDSDKASEFVDHALELINKIIAADIDMLISELNLPYQLEPKNES